MTSAGMRALVWYGASKLGMEDLPQPEPAPGQVIVDVDIAGICGSDMHPYRGHHGPRRPPLVLGHEAVGRVPGREGRFAIFPLISCGTCPACLRGSENLCVHRGLLGLDRQGVFADRVAVDPQALILMPAGLDDRLGALVEPLATPLAALEEHPPPPGEPVAVIGCGPIGLLAVHVCRTRGIPVVAVDPVGRRREYATLLGAERTFADAAELPAATYPLVLDAVGVEPTWNGAIAAARAGGQVVVVGLGQPLGELPVGDLVRRAIGVRGHYAYTRAQFVAALDLLAEHPVPLDWVDVMPLASGADAFARLAAPDAPVTKVMLTTGAAHTLPIDSTQDAGTPAGEDPTR